MASLLGSKYCIESLRSDVTDLQSSVVDVLSRCGPVDAASWKYPDRRAADVDLTQLLELYDYSDDEEDRQLAHVVLLELVIDRFVLLLQSLTRHNESLGGGKLGGGIKSGAKSGHTSIGLVVKAYWNRMLQTHSSVQQLQAEKKANTKKMVDLENQVKKLTEEVDMLTDTVTSMEQAARTMGSNQTPFPLNDKDAAVVRALTSASNYSISRDEYNKCTQTLETAFVPCESCDYVQHNLRDVGDFAIGVCTAQGLPSSLAKYKAQIDGLDWLSGNDVARWSSETNKDLTRISKHLDGLLATIEPLEKDLAAIKKQNRELEKKMSDVQNDMKLERETTSTVRKQFQSKIDELKKESATKIDNVEKEKELLDKGKKELAEQISTMKSKLDEQKQILQVLETEKVKLERDVASNQANHSQVRDLESGVATLISQLDEVKDKLKTSDQELAREKARVKSMEKQNESVQGRQDALIARLEKLSSESEELRDRMEDLEEEKYQMEEALERAKEQRTQLEDQLKEEKSLVKQLECEKESLEQSMSDLQQDIGSLEQRLNETQEREKLLIEYPDLNGPVNPDYVGTGDIVVDMDKQIQANSVRIQVLEEQNSKLRRTVSKMMERQRANNQPSKPVPLWSNPTPAEPTQPAAQAYSYNSKLEAKVQQYMEVQQQQQQQQQYSHPPVPTSHDLPPRPPPKPQPPGKLSPINHQHNQHQHNQHQQPSSQHIQTEFVIGRGATSTTPKSRPSSATKSNNKSGKTTTDPQHQYRPNSASKSSSSNHHRPTSASSSVAAYAKLKDSGLLRNRPGSGKASDPGSSHGCSVCNRTYNNAKDLEIHQMYCY